MCEPVSLSLRGLWYVRSVVAPGAREVQALQALQVLQVEKLPNTDANGDARGVARARRRADRLPAADGGGNAQALAAASMI